MTLKREAAEGMERALIQMLADSNTNHISDEHVAARHEREPDQGYDSILLARRALRRWSEVSQRKLPWTGISSPH